MHIHAHIVHKHATHEAHANWREICAGRRPALRESYRTQAAHQWYTDGPPICWLGALETTNIHLAPAGCVISAKCLRS